MQSKLLISSMLIFLLFSSSASALQTSWGEIVQIRATSASQAYIYVSGLDDPFGCGSTSFVRFYWSNSNADKLWSLVLAAQMAKKQVSFAGSCVSGYLSATIVYVRD